MLLGLGTIECLNMQEGVQVRLEVRLVLAIILIINIILKEI